MLFVLRFVSFFSVGEGWMAWKGCLEGRLSFFCFCSQLACDLGLFSVSEIDTKSFIVEIECDIKGKHSPENVINLLCAIRWWRTAREPIRRMPQLRCSSRLLKKENTTNATDKKRKAHRQAESACALLWHWKWKLIALFSARADDDQTRVLQKVAFRNVAPLVDELAVAAVLGSLKFHSRKITWSREVVINHFCISHRRAACCSASFYWPVLSMLYGDSFSDHPFGTEDHKIHNKQKRLFLMTLMIPRLHRMSFEWHSHSRNAPVLLPCLDATPCERAFKAASLVEWNFTTERKIIERWTWNDDVELCSGPLNSWNYIDLSASVLNGSNDSFSQTAKFIINVVYRVHWPIHYSELAGCGWKNFLNILRMVIMMCEGELGKALNLIDSTRALDGCLSNKPSRCRCLYSRVEKRISTLWWFIPRHHLCVCVFGSQWERWEL